VFYKNVAKIQKYLKLGAGSRIFFGIMASQARFGLCIFVLLRGFIKNEMDWNLLHFFTRNTATAFCLTTPLFLTILTLNLPKVNIVTYRITAIIGVIIGLYNMMNFFNPHTVFLGVVHIPLLTISLYSAILSYRVTRKQRMELSEL